MKIKYIVISIAIIPILIIGVFIYERFHVDFHMDENGQSVSVIGGADGPTSIFVAGKLEGKEEKSGFQVISMDEAKKAFSEDGSFLIVDVRRADEYATGHIPGAINIANEDINDDEPEELPDKDQRIYVYCRSGRRSKEAAAKLVALGYTNIVECGGILDWTGDLE